MESELANLERAESAVTATFAPWTEVSLLWNDGSVECAPTRSRTTAFGALLVRAHAALVLDRLMLDMPAPSPAPTFAVHAALLVRSRTEDGYDSLLHA